MNNFFDTYPNIYKRLPVALSLIAAFLVFLLMQFLISSNFTKKDKDSDISYLEFIRIKSDDDLQARDRRIPDKPKLEKRPPPPPDIELQKDETLMKPDLDIDLPDFNIPTDFSGAFLGKMDDLGKSSSSLIPMLKVAAKCPLVALEGGIDGKVSLYLVVDSAGKVITARVTRSTPSKIFNKEATKAIRRWQFKPKVVNGIPVEQAGTLEMEFLCNA